MAARELGTRLITLDSSAMLASMDVRDVNHERIVKALDRERGSLIVPVATLAEISHFIERDLGQRTLALFIEDIAQGAFVLDCGEQGWSRIGELITRYADVPLGLADAVVIECAERHGGRVMTLDRRHFDVVAREGTIDVLPHGV